MLELYKGQISLDDLQYSRSYKEALLLRESRVQRYKKERDEAEREREREAAKQTRNTILKK